MSVIRIPPSLRDAVLGARQIEAQGQTVRELLEDAARQFPALGSLIFAAGELVPFVNVYLDGEDVRVLAGLESKASTGAQLILLPAMAGGSSSPALAARAARVSASEQLALGLAEVVAEQLVEPGEQRSIADVKASPLER